MTLVGKILIANPNRDETEVYFDCLSKQLIIFRSDLLNKVIFLSKDNLKGEILFYSIGHNQKFCIPIREFLYLFKEI